MKTRLFCFWFLSFWLFSCADKYRPYTKNYSIKSPDGRPDYSQFDYWAAHPWKPNPSDSIPAPLRNEPRDSVVDVFFLHPTTHTNAEQTHIRNAPVDDAYLNAKTDYSSILFQASVFNQHARIFSPRYRQAHINEFYKKENDAADVFDTAYADIKKAFEYYLQNWNGSRPIIIAGHSQGALMAERLLKDYFQGKLLMNKLVAAYIIGWPVPKNYFTDLKICTDSLQTSCICSWRTFRNNYVPPYLKSEGGNAYVTNPLSWHVNEEWVSKRLNKGSVLTKFNKVYKQTTGARISNGLLYVRKPKFPWGFLYFTKNYHIADINLFYINIRRDVERRIGLYWKQ
jgi:hypothetical protein